MRRISRRVATRRNPEEQIGTVIGIGRTLEAAERDADKHLRQMEHAAMEAVHGNRARPRRKNKAKRRHNVAAGYTDSRGFHPIRASYDYDPVRTGEAGRPRPYGTKAPIRRKKKKTRRKKNAAKRRPLNFGERMKRLRARKKNARKRARK